MFLTEHEKEKDAENRITLAVEGASNPWICRNPAYMTQTISTEEGWLKTTITHKVCNVCRQDGGRNSKQSWKLKLRVTDSTNAAAAELGEPLPDAAATDTVSHQHYDSSTGLWKPGGLAHDWVTVECAVDESMYISDTPDAPKIPTKGNPTPISMRCVVDTGTQITAMGWKHAAQMGIDKEKLSKTGTKISGISGEQIFPIGSFFATIKGTKKLENGKRKEILTKEIVYVFEKTPAPYISRSVLITLGVVKPKMDVGDFAQAGGGEHNLQGMHGGQR